MSDWILKGNYYCYCAASGFPVADTHLISDCDSDEDDENDDFETMDEAAQQKKYEIGDSSSEMEKVCDFGQFSTVVKIDFLFAFYIPKCGKTWYRTPRDRC